MITLRKNIDTGEIEYGIQGDSVNLTVDYDRDGFDGTFTVNVKVLTLLGLDSDTIKTYLQNKVQEKIDEDIAQNVPTFLSQFVDVDFDDVI